MNQRRNKKYGLRTERFRELYYFCLQYPLWKIELESKAELTAVNIDGMPHGTDTGDPTAQAAIRRERLRDKLALIDKTAKDAGGDIADAILYAATTGATFDQIKAKRLVYCERDMFYQRRRLFYWLLDQRVD